MKIAYVGIDLLKCVLDTVLDSGCEVIKLFTCHTDNVTEFNTGVIDSARRAGIPYTLEPNQASGSGRSGLSGMRAAVVRGLLLPIAAERCVCDGQRPSGAIARVSRGLADAGHAVAW